jgi:hypothetical protein
MKSWTRAALILLATVLLSSAFTLTPTPAEAYLLCDNTLHYANSWGVGADCGQAIDDLYANASALVYCPYGTCMESFQFGNCWWNDMKGMYQVDGRIVYQCYEPCVPHDGYLCPEDPPGGGES